MGNLTTTKMSSETFSEAQLKEYKEAFSLFDRDGDGKIAAKEIGIVMRSLGQMPTEEELQTIVEGVGSDSVDFPKFCQVMKENKKEPASAEEIKEASVFSIKTEKVLYLAVNFVML